MTENELTEKIIGHAMEVHSTLGPGLLESSYKECLFFNLKEAGFDVEKEKGMPLVFKQVRLECGYRIDLLVNNRVVIELKSVEAINDVHLAQSLTYMKLGNFQRGLLINFNVKRLKEGIKSLVNGYEPSV
jgi:GxxExxY protein